MCLRLASASRASSSCKGIEALTEEGKLTTGTTEGQCSKAVQQGSAARRGTQGKVVGVREFSTECGMGGGMVWGGVSGAEWSGME